MTPAFFLSSLTLEAEQNTTTLTLLAKRRQLYLVGLPKSNLLITRNRSANKHFVHHITITIPMTTDDDE